MSLEFPSRFLKKLDIYQQIRSGQGVTKYKKLWKYESAFLQAAYGEPHQHLNSFSDKNQVIEWIKNSLPEYSRNDYEEIIGNLFYKGYLEARDKQRPIPSELVTRDDQAIRNHELAQTFEYRVTPEGLLVGEVLSEIENKNYFLRWLNRYRYSWVLDTVWLLVFFGLYKILFSTQDVLFYLSSKVGYQVDTTTFKLVVLLGLWPFVSYLYRKIYICVEGSQN